MGRERGLRGIQLFQEYELSARRMVSLVGKLESLRSLFRTSKFEESDSNQKWFGAEFTAPGDR
eukprot:3791933-Prymnesium_polylepis.1